MDFMEILVLVGGLSAFAGLALFIYLRKTRDRPSRDGDDNEPWDPAIAWKPFGGDAEKGDDSKPEKPPK